MIKHIVMWKLVEPAEAARFKEMLETCKGIVPGMREFEVAVQAEGFEANHDVALYSVFEDEASLQSYIVHPRHKEVVATLPARASRSVFDYQT